jgi:phosphate/sulfate permease
MDREQIERIERKINRIGTLAVWTAGLITGAIAIALFVWIGSPFQLRHVAIAALIGIVIVGVLRFYWQPFRN